MTDALQCPNFRFQRLDLRTDSLEELVVDAEVIFHLAATPGLTKSWIDFDGYWTCNVLATQRLLEAVRLHARRLRRFVYGSTSSVYGRFASGDESLPTKPISPYGVTKLAAENLCRAYVEEHSLPGVVLRFFSVYGPRQRPDMGYYRFMKAIQCGEPVVVYGDGQQVRGNTYVDDCVAATIAAAEGHVGETYNIGGGEAASVLDILERLKLLTGRKFAIRREPARAGDQRYTFADTTKLHRHFGWRPRCDLDAGLASQWQWLIQQSAVKIMSEPAPVVSALSAAR